jgi:hypothetical protein
MPSRRRSRRASIRRGRRPSAAPHEALDRDDGVARIDRLRRLRRVADDDRAVGEVAHDGRQQRALPSSSLSTTATPLRTVATRELVVPRSMPTASRCWCGAVDMPGSAICSSAIRFYSSAFERVIDFVLQLFDEHQAAHAYRRHRRISRLFDVELPAESRRPASRCRHAACGVPDPRARDGHRVARFATASRHSICSIRNARRHRRVVSAGRRRPARSR